MAMVETVERPLLKRVSWGALFAGLFIGFGIWFLLLSLIAAIGISGVNPRDMSSWSSLGVGFGIWGGIAGIISVFLGAWCATRLSVAADREEGLLYGVTVWALILVTGLWLAATAISGAAALAQSAASAAAQAAPQAARQAQQSAQQAMQQPGQIASQVGQAAARGGRPAAWGLFVGAALMLIAGALGGVLGVARWRRPRMKAPARETTPVPPERPLAPQRT